MSGADDPFASHLARWRAQEPEMEFAEPFVPASLRPRFRAWGTLLAELERSLFTPSDATIALQRLAWWHDELGSRQPQHPVARALAAAGMAPGLAAPVAGAAALLAQDDTAPADTDAALARFGAYADAVLRAEQSLFGGDPAPAARELVGTGLLVRWAPRLHESALLREHLPLQLLARHAQVAQGAAQALAIDLARALAGRRHVTESSLPLYRALRWRFDRHRLGRLAAGVLPQPQRPSPGPLRATLMAWHTARRAPATSA